MKTAELMLSYFAQGDDLSFCLDEMDGDLPRALRLRADSLLEVVMHLNDLARSLEDSGQASLVSVEASSHNITFNGPDELIDELLEEELLVPEGQCEQMEPMEFEASEDD